MGGCSVCMFLNNILYEWSFFLSFFVPLNSWKLYKHSWILLRDVFEDLFLHRSLATSLF